MSDLNRTLVISSDSNVTDFWLEQAIFQIVSTIGFIFSYAAKRSRFYFFFRINPELAPSPRGEAIVLTHIRQLAAVVNNEAKMYQSASAVNQPGYLRSLHRQRYHSALDLFDEAIFLSRKFGYTSAQSTIYIDYLEKPDDPFTYPLLIPKFTEIEVN